MCPKIFLRLPLIGKSPCYFSIMQNIYIYLILFSINGVREQTKLVLEDTIVKIPSHNLTGNESNQTFKGSCPEQQPGPSGISNKRKSCDTSMCEPPSKRGYSSSNSPNTTCDNETDGKTLIHI